MSASRPSFVSRFWSPFPENHPCHCVTRYHFAPESSPFTNTVWKLILASRHHFIQRPHAHCIDVPPLCKRMYIVLLHCRLLCFRREVDTGTPAGLEHTPHAQFSYYRSVGTTDGKVTNRAGSFVRRIRESPQLSPALRSRRSGRSIESRNVREESNRAQCDHSRAVPRCRTYISDTLAMHCILG